MTTQRTNNSPLARLLKEKYISVVRFFLPWMINVSFQKLVVCFQIQNLRCQTHPFGAALGKMNSLFSSSEYNKKKFNRLNNLSDSSVITLQNFDYLINVDLIYF